MQFTTDDYDDVIMGDEFDSDGDIDFRFGSRRGYLHRTDVELIAAHLNSLLGNTPKPADTQPLNIGRVSVEADVKVLPVTTRADALRLAEEIVGNGCAGGESILDVARFLVGEG